VIDLLHHAKEDPVHSRICQEVPGIHISRSAFVGGHTITMKSKADEEVGVNFVGLAKGISHLGCACRPWGQLEEEFLVLDSRHHRKQDLMDQKEGEPHQDLLQALLRISHRNLSPVWLGELGLLQAGSHQTPLSILGTLPLCVLIQSASTCLLSLLQKLLGLLSRLIIAEVGAEYMLAEIFLACFWVISGDISMRLSRLMGLSRLLLRLGLGLLFGTTTP
jgi:hypothetical protein